MDDVRGEWIGTEVRVSSKLSRCKWDLSFLSSKTQNQVNVEFDGESHYCDINVIRRDFNKNEEAKRLGEAVVRIPYWVQLTSETYDYYFDKYLSTTVKITQNFPHGFIDHRAHLPASFCEMGIERFAEELDALPFSVREDIIHSLEVKIIGVANSNYIVPSLILDSIVDFCRSTAIITMTTTDESA